jgi:hypothetical protein
MRHIPGLKPKSERLYVMFQEFSRQSLDLLQRLDSEQYKTHRKEETSKEGFEPGKDSEVETIREIEALFQAFLEGCQRLVPSVQVEPGLAGNIGPVPQSHKTEGSIHPNKPRPWRLSRCFVKQ